MCIKCFSNETAMEPSNLRLLGAFGGVILLYCLLWIESSYRWIRQAYQTSSLTDCWSMLYACMIICLEMGYLWRRMYICSSDRLIVGNSEPMLSNSFVLNSDLLGQNMEQIEVFSCLSSLLLSKYHKSRTSDHAIGLLKWFWSIMLKVK